MKKMARMTTTQLHAEYKSAKGFAAQYSQKAQDSFIPSEREEFSKIASKYQREAGELIKEIAIRQQLEIASAQAKSEEVAKEEEGTRMDVSKLKKNEIAHLVAQRYVDYKHFRDLLLEMKRYEQANYLFNADRTSHYNGEFCAKDAEATAKVSTKKELTKALHAIISATDIMAEQALEGSALA